MVGCYLLYLNRSRVILYFCFCNAHLFCLCGVFCRDLQSYFADLSLFLVNDSKKMYILVDNRPWLSDLGSRGVHIWQLMVTKVGMLNYLICM